MLAARHADPIASVRALAILPDRPPIRIEHDADDRSRGGSRLHFDRYRPEGRCSTPHPADSLSPRPEGAGAVRARDEEILRGSSRRAGNGPDAEEIERDVRPPRRS